MKPNFEEKYFFAANSGRGFIGGYKPLIEKAERVFIIKGGPGTGKSSFMREIGRNAEKNRAHTVYYYCSSDPDSLDAVFIDSRLLFLDGTAPHAVEPGLPGAKDEIINLGAFWDSAGLLSKKERIAYISKQKAEAFSVAYKYLSAAEKFSEVAERLISPAVLTHKLERAVERICNSLPAEKEGKTTEIYTTSYGMKGKVELDTLERRAGVVFGVSDVLGTAHFFLDRLKEIAEKTGHSITVSYDPLCPEQVEAVYFERAEVLYKKNADGYKNINMQRFLDTELSPAVRSDIKKALRMRNVCVEYALDAMKRASEHHFALEKIYGDAMDFAAKEEFTDNFIGELFDTK